MKLNFFYRVLIYNKKGVKRVNRMWNLFTIYSENKM